MRNDPSFLHFIFHKVVGSNVIIALLQISIQQWKKFENGLIFAKDTDKYGGDLFSLTVY